MANHIVVDLSKKHAVELLPVQIDTFDRVVWRALSVPRPNLQRHVQDWREDQIAKAAGDAGKLRRIENDLGPRRVGVAKITQRTGTFRMQNVPEIVLECDPISWAAHEIMQQKELRDGLPAEERFEVLAVTVALVTDDHKVIMQKRSDRVSTYKNMWDGAAAGWVDCHEDVALGTIVNIHLHHDALRELQQEVGLKQSQIYSLRLAGFSRHLTDYAIFEANYVVRTNLTASEVLTGAAHAVDRWEGYHAAFTQGEAIRLLETEVIKPAGAAALMYALGLA